MSDVLDHNPSWPIAGIHTRSPVVTATTLRVGVDPDRITERLLWLEAQGLHVAAEARRLRRRVPRVALVDADELAREVARLAIVARSREDEVAIWRVELEPPTPAPAPPPRPVPMPAPLRRWWWLW